MIGDSPADIEAGHANGVQTLAVATGFYSEQELAELNPTFILPDLADTEGVRQCCLILSGLQLGSKPQF